MISRRFSHNSSELKIFGDGKQTKPYVHIYDILKALRILESKFNCGYNVFNVGSLDFLSVKEIVDIIVKKEFKECKYTRWIKRLEADVPQYKLDTSKIETLME